MIDPRIIVALDFSDINATLEFVKQLNPQQCRLKVGKELFTSYGPMVVEKIMRQGFEVFLDLKFHDIPNTVAQAVFAAARLNVWMVNVHALGGRKMLEAAHNILQSAKGHKPLLIAVTVLTSMNDEDLHDIGLLGKLTDNVIRLTKMTKEAGLNGVVCSPQEISILRQAFGNEFCLVTPGIRLADAEKHDQKRTLTPAEAIRAGANYLVIGRAITQAADPMAVLNTIELDISGADMG